MGLKVLNTIIIEVFLVLLVLGNGCCFKMYPITGIEIAIGTYNPKGFNIILSVRIRDDLLSWGPWQPTLTTNQFQTVRQHFEDDILCVTSGVDLIGLRLLSFRTRKGKFITINSDFPSYYPFLCGYPHFTTFSFKGSPLINIMIDSSVSRIKTFWDPTSKQEANKLVVLDSGNGTFKQYLIKSTEDNSPPNDTCYWSDERAFLSRGQINAIILESGRGINGTKYNMALSIRYGQSWETHGHHENGLQKHRLNLENIIAFVYDYKDEVVGFTTRQRNYTFGTGYVPYKRFSMFGKECTVAFFTGYSKMHRQPQNPWLLRAAEKLFENGTIMQVDPQWLCEIPNKICKKNATGQFVCACIDGFIAHGELCRKACSPLIPDGYFGMENIENARCPREPGSVCSVVSCTNNTVNFRCHEGSWKPINTTATTVSSRPIAVTDCHRSCYLDPKSQNCVINENRGKTSEQMRNMLNDSINQLKKAVNFCYENNGSAECRDRMFKCYSTGQIILMRKVCDHIKDCNDASDEICGADKGKNRELFAIFGGLFGILGGGAGGSSGSEEGPDEKICEWTSWTEIRDKCDSMCGKAGRKGKTDVKFGFGDSCKKRRKTRKRRCKKDNLCLTCDKSKCHVDVNFKNFKEPDSWTDLRAYIISKTQGGKVSFSTTFISDKICSCQITNEYELKCKTKMKGWTTFIVMAQNEADEKLTMTINVTIGDYPVKFIKDKLVFENFLESRTVNATYLAKDEDKEDKIEFTKVELTDNPGQNILKPQERKITSLYFQIEQFIAGEINCSITVSSGGHIATSVVRLIVGKDLHCPTCKLGGNTCKKQIVYEFFDFENQKINEDSGMFHPRQVRMAAGTKRKRAVSVAGGTPKVLKRHTVIQGCSLPYNQYFKQWISDFDIDFKPYPLLDQSPYVLSGRDARVDYTIKSTNETITVDTMAIYLREMQKIYKEGVKKMKNITRSFISRLHDLNLIGFATLYKTKPESVSEKLNIQFDHIPPKSAHPTGAFEDVFSGNAPTLAISNFDHRSEVWKRCSTGNQFSTPILNLYDVFMKKYLYACAIFANLKCIQDKELGLGKDDRLYDNSDQTAFKRYRQGFKGLVNLHFDYGTNFNYAYKVNLKRSAVRPYAAYCEIKQPDFVNPKVECQKDPTCVEETFGSETYYYIRNSIVSTIPSLKSKCGEKNIRTERNILRAERELLTKFIDGSTPQAEKDLWNKCCSDPSILCANYLDAPK